MYKNCSTPQSLLRQKKMSQVLVEMLQMQSFHEITVSALCKRADVPRKAFYRYFDSKNDVISYLANEVVEETFMKAELSAYAGKTSQFQSILGMTQYWYEHQDLLRALADQECLGIFYQTYITSMQELVHNVVGVKEHERSYVLSFFASSFLFIFINWQQQNFDKPPVELAKLIEKIVNGKVFIN